MYAYCGNNPIMYIDPNGTFVSTILGALIGAFWGGINAMLNGQNVWAGIAVGAATGALSGFLVDTAIISFGTSIPGTIIAVSSLVVGGFGVGFAGDIATQVFV